MKNTSTTLYLFLLLISITLLLTPATTAVTCYTVFDEFKPCLDFVVGKVAEVPEECCFGLGQLVHSAVTATDRQAVCTCLLRIVNRTPLLKDKYLKQLQSACFIPFPFHLKSNCDQDAYIEEWK